METRHVQSVFVTPAALETPSGRILAHFLASMHFDIVTTEWCQTSTTRRDPLTLMADGL